MLRIGIALLGLLLSLNTFASRESSLSLLDNRFRVDPTITQITFVIYREQGSQPVVLVRPDGKKYYATRNPDNVRWYQEPTMDIISIDNPMPGPWQAIGKVSPKNNVKLISHLQLTSDTFPTRIYQGEEMKFTARLTSDDKPLLLKDFLERVNLKVTFRKYIEDEESLVKEARPVPTVIGEFADDGRDLDEKPGDGVFTVKLNITPEPGKYRVRITSGNGVFLRALEQEVLVYPSPLSSSFIQSRVANEPHQVVISGEQGMIEPGSLAAHIRHQSPDNKEFLVEGVAEPESLKMTLTVPYDGDLGNYAWEGGVYATDLASKRPLYFPIKESTYSVVQELDLEQARLMQEAEAEQRRKIAQEQLLQKVREERRTQYIIYIAIGNVVVILLALVGWFFMSKFKARKEMLPEMQLNMPKK